MKFILFVLVFVSPFASATRYTAAQLQACEKAAQVQLFEEVTKYEDEDNSEKVSRFEDFDIQSEIRIEGSKIFVTAEILLAIEGPYDGTRVVRWDYGMKTGRNNACKVINESELEDEIYD